MSHFSFWIVVFLSLKTYAAIEETCGESDITGAVGETATLRIGYNGIKPNPHLVDIEGIPTLKVGPHPVIMIDWHSDEGFLLMTTQGLPNFMLPNETQRFPGRLNTTLAGSLVISNLKPEDQGIYRAEILKDKLEECIYHLTVFNNKTADSYF